MKGLLFTEPMFRAATREIDPKTQTRRMESGLRDVNKHPERYELWPDDELSNKGVFVIRERHPKGNIDIEHLSRYTPGEVVYLKEPFKVINYRQSYAVIFYKYSERYDTVPISEKTFAALKMWNRIGSMVSPMMMFEDFARYKAVITKVRCERLCDISEQDTVAEGWLWEKSELQTPREWFKQVISEIHGPKLWDHNPWVFAYNFKIQKV